MCCIVNCSEEEKTPLVEKGDEEIVPNTTHLRVMKGSTECDMANVDA